MIMIITMIMIMTITLTMAMLTLLIMIMPILREGEYNYRVKNVESDDNDISREIMNDNVAK